MVQAIKMKFVTSRTRALMVATALILAISIIVPVAAKKPTHLEASGTIDGYVDAWSSVIVGGHWSVTVKEGVLQYTAMYHELNLAEDPEMSPVGSVDIFTHIFTTDDPDDYELKGNVLKFSGEMQVVKVWTKLDWTTEVIIRDPSLVTITITKDTFYLDSLPPGPVPGDPWDQCWDRYGTTNYFN